MWTALWWAESGPGRKYCGCTAVGVKKDGEKTEVYVLRSCGRGEEVEAWQVELRGPLRGGGT